MDTLTRIRAFIDVVEAEGFSAAARKTGRSKALLSKYVRELEDDLGALLLNRTTRQFSLTEAGHTYYRTASDILKEIDNLADLVREKNADLKGKLRISVPRTFIDAEVGQSLIDFAKENPELSLEIVAEDRFVDLIEEGFDLAIRITRLEDSGLIARKLSDFGSMRWRRRISSRNTDRSMVRRISPAFPSSSTPIRVFIIRCGIWSRMAAQIRSPSADPSRSTAHRRPCAPPVPASASPWCQTLSPGPISSPENW